MDMSAQQSAESSKALGRQTNSIRQWTWDTCLTLSQGALRNAFEWGVVFLPGASAHSKCVLTEYPFNSELLCASLRLLSTPNPWRQTSLLEKARISLGATAWVLKTCSLCEFIECRQWKPGRRMKFKTHLQMENQTFNHNRNTRSQAGSLNRWIYPSSVEESLPLTHLELRFRTTEIETLRGKSLRTTLIAAPGLSSARKVLSR